MDHVPEGTAPVFPPWWWFPLQYHPGHVCPEAYGRQLGEHRLLWRLHITVVRGSDPVNVNMKKKWFMALLPFLFLYKHTDIWTHTTHTAQPGKQNLLYNYECPCVTDWESDHIYTIGQPNATLLIWNFPNGCCSYKKHSFLFHCCQLNILVVRVDEYDPQAKQDFQFTKSSLQLINNINTKHKTVRPQEHVGEKSYWLQHSLRN